MLSMGPALRASSETVRPSGEPTTGQGGPIWELVARQKMAPSSIRRTLVSRNIAVLLREPPISPSLGYLK